MEQTLKRKIVDAAEAIKKKVKKMRDFETENAKSLQEVFKHITGSLNKMIEINTNNTNGQQCFLEDLQPNKRKISIDKAYKHENNIISKDENKLEDDEEEEEEVEDDEDDEFEDEKGSDDSVDLE
ncbi:hypothetical protein O0L34_g19472 [Tuta absoluta]|nr:hypothetical protein O0L34_g19472 [Tuta absoluta]